MIVRDATTGDIGAITAIYNHHIRASDAIWLDEELPESDRLAWFEQQRARGDAVLVAVDGDEVIGYAAWFPFREKSGYWPTVEHTILLAPAHTGRGVGHVLLGALIERARAAGKLVMVAGCDGGNEGAIRFHESLGFRRVAEMPGIGRKHGRPVDLVLLQLDLDVGADVRRQPTTECAVVVFDLGGVVCRALPDRRLAALAQLSGLPVPVIERAVFESGFDDAGERGRFSAEQFTAQLRSLLSLPDGPDTEAQLRRAWSLAYEPDPAVVRIIGRTSMRTALLTNNGPLIEAALAHELVEVGAVFDDLLCSWRLGAVKPQREAFVRATEQLGVDPIEVLFFDDSIDNVNAATAAGWRAHRFTTALDLQATLAAIGVH